MAIARDKFWMFGTRPHQDDIWLMGEQGTKSPYFFKSRITPTEGAHMLDISNMVMVVCDHEPAPYSRDAFGYMESFYRMNKVLWGANRGGKLNEYELGFILELVEKYPNFSGVFMDDISNVLRKTDIPEEEKRAAFLKMLSGTKKILAQASRPLESYITWYWHEDPIPGMMDYVDCLSLWTWNSDELPLLKERFEAVEKKFPNTKFLLGIYMYDFKNRKPTPNELMELQCNYALKLLRQGRIEGIIFEANSVMGVDLPSEHWLREWIEKAKYTEIPD